MPVADYNLAIEIYNVAHKFTSIGLQTDFQIALDIFLGMTPRCVV